MADEAGTLKDQVMEIRRRRTVPPEHLKGSNGIILDNARRAGLGDKALAMLKLTYTPYSLMVIAGLVTGLVEIVDRFLDVLKDEGLGFGRLAKDAQLRAKLEFSAYLLFVLDVFAMQNQKHELRLELFYVATQEVLKALQKISPEYQESEFSDELYRRMSQYGAAVREPDTVLRVPTDVAVWNMLMENLTAAVSESGFKREELGGGEWVKLLSGSESELRRISDRNKPLDTVSYVYAAICQEAAANYRLLINELFSATKDITVLSEDDVTRVVRETEAKIARLSEQDRNNE